MTVTFTSNRRIYFAQKRGGDWFWTIWWSYEDGHVGEDGKRQWLATDAHLFWFFRSAVPFVRELQIAHDAGWSGKLGQLTRPNGAKTSI